MMYRRLCSVTLQLSKWPGCAAVSPPGLTPVAACQSTWGMLQSAQADLHTSRRTHFNAGWQLAVH